MITSYFGSYRKAEARLTDQHVPNYGLTTVKATVVYCLAGWTSSGEIRSAAGRRGGHTEELKRNREHTTDPEIL